MMIHANLIVLWFVGWQNEKFEALEDMDVWRMGNR